MANQQPQLVAVPAPNRAHPGHCRLPTRYGAVKPCPNPADGLVADWTAPLDLAQQVGACQDCADIYRLDLQAF